MTGRRALLLIQDRAPEASPLASAIAGAPGLDAELVHARTLRDGLAVLAAQPATAVVIDLCLPGPAGLDDVKALRGYARGVPLIAIVADEEAALGEAARAAVACDVVLASEVGRALIGRVVAHAIERRALEDRLRDQADLDPLTGLLTRRAARAAAPALLAAGARTGRRVAVLHAHVRGLAAINARAGVAAGHEVVRTVAGALRETFRASDLIARVGGDDFVVLALEGAAGALEHLAARLDDRLADLNRRRPGAAPVDVGVSLCAVDASAPLDDLFFPGPPAARSPAAARPAAAGGAEPHLAAL